MEAVHFVEGHDVQHLLDERHTEVVAPHIQQHASPGKSWRVCDLHMNVIQTTAEGQALHPDQIQ